MNTLQGFDKKLNLSENSSDRDVLNNLGISPIADDIALFMNNMRNTSELLVTTDKRFGNTIRFNPLAQGFIFTNGTKITAIDGNTTVGEYFVGNSNNINEFQLFSDVNLNAIVSSPPAGDNIRYVRSDAVTKEDIANLVRRRDLVVETQSNSQIIEPDNSVTASVYTSLRRVYNSLGGQIPNSLSGYLREIETEFDTFGQKKEKSIINNKNFETDQKIIVTGSIIISDPDNYNDNSANTAGPGLFILDTTTNQAKRAFSDNENIWSVDGTDLVVDSEEVVIGNLVLDDGIRILRKDELPLISTETDLATSFTHFVKVTINGEDYSLCLK
jgi:hypothetical protein